jgi:hypothetical protein
MKAGRVNSCPVCGGRGWKFLGFRRSVASAGDAGERVLLTRARVTCLACSGQPDGADGGPDGD